MLRSPYRLADPSALRSLLIDAGFSHVSVSSSENFTPSASASRVTPRRWPGRLLQPRPSRIDAFVSKQLGLQG